MTGYPECNYPAFHAATAKLRDAGFTVMNPAENTLEGVYEDFLREDLKQLLECEGIAVLPGWTQSLGASNEIRVGRILKMPFMRVEEWLRST